MFVCWLVRRSVIISLKGREVTLAAIGAPVTKKVTKELELKVQFVILEILGYCPPCNICHDYVQKLIKPLFSSSLYLVETLTLL